MSKPQRLSANLYRANTMLRLAASAAASGVTVAALLSVVLGAVLLDAVFGLPSWTLIVLDVLILLACLGSAAWVVLAWRRNSFDPRRTARVLEQRLALHDSRFINAVDLAVEPGGSAALRALAIDRGESLASAVATFSAIDPRPLRRSAFAASTAILIVAIIALAAPHLFGMVVPRYLHPNANLPPFTLLTFHVTVEPNRVYYGKPATIRVVLSGPFQPETADVVFTDTDPRDRVPMHRQEPGVFVVPIDRAENSRRFYIDTPRGRSHAQALAVLPVPRFEKASVSYRFPAYTAWPPVDRPLDGSGLRALIGTRATITVRSNLPLRGGELRVTAGTGSGSQSNERLSPSSEDPMTATGGIELTEDGAYELTLTAFDGTPGDEKLTGPISLVADRPPSVQLLSPDLRVNAPEGWKVPVKVAASDDIGVRRIVLHHRLNDSAGTEIDLPLSQEHPTYAAGSIVLDLNKIGAKAGDTIRGFATAFDNRPNPAQSADSPSFEVRVLSQDEYKVLARQEYQLQDLLAELEKLAADRDRLDQTQDKLIEQLEALKKKAGENGDNLSPQDQAKAKDLRKQLEEYGKQSQDLAKQIEDRAGQMTLYEFEPAIQDQLRQAAQQLRDQAEGSGASAPGLSHPSLQSLDDALKQLKKDRHAAGQAREAHQLTERLLRQLQLADRIMAEGDGVMGITERQRDIAERLTPYRDQARPLAEDDKSRLHQLAQEQEQLGQELTETLDRMEAAAKDAGEDLPKMSASSQDFVKNVRDKLDVPRDQSNATSGARALRGHDAHASADSAASKLESLIKECKGMGDCACDDLDGAFQLTRSQLGGALSQLSGARRGNASGRGYGSGAAAQAGSGSTASGSQAGGAANRATLVGPHARSSGKPTGQTGLHTGSYNSLTGAFDPASTAEAQVLDPDSTGAGANASPGPPGVPMPYRRLAEQYFRRLAEDNR